MKIILNKDVENLGEEGDICDVAPGYARNYLIPQSLAVKHNKQNLSIFEHKRKAIEKRKNEKRKTAQSLKERLDGMEIFIQMPAGREGKLFGSVSPATIVEEMEKEGINLVRKQINIPSGTIKSSGVFNISINLYNNEEATLAVYVNQKEIASKNQETASAQEKKETQPEDEEIRTESLSASTDVENEQGPDFSTQEEELETEEE